MKSSKPSSASSRVIIFFIVLVIIIGSLWVWWQDILLPVDPHDNTPVTFVVRRGDGVKHIAAELTQQRLIKSPTGFFILIKLLGVERDLEAGDFRLNRTMEAKSIARELTHGILDIWVTILEGWRVEEIATKLAKELDIPETEFLRYAEEGYMFPDTYLMPRDASASAISRILRATFDEKISDSLKQNGQNNELSFDQIITLASIVEREGQSDSDRPEIAGILLKRLKAGWPLQADATIQYALGYQPNEKTWWKKSLGDDDKKIKSPFNTYLHPGLPPKPIANPGLASIKAVLYPKDTEYWFYLHDDKGQVHFAKTIEEHNHNIAKYIL